MSKQHYIQPTTQSEDSVVVRLGAGSGSANNLSYLDQGKLVKMVGESRYDLCAAGDSIEGRITSVEAATSGGFTIGGINDQDRMIVIADGLQATPGTGTIAVGDYVVAGTITAKGTALTSYPKVCKATYQPGGVLADLAAAAAAIKQQLFAWRVESILKESGPAAVGDAMVIARVTSA